MADLPGRRRLRHARARGARGRRPHRARPARRAARRASAPSCDRHPAPAVDPGALADALRPRRRHPARPARRRPRLADLAPADRLAELDFELPLAGGDAPDADVRARRPRPAAAPPPATRRPARRLPGPARAALAPSRCAATSPAASTPCCACATPSGTSVVDYKTNWLGPIGPDGREPLLAGHYTPQRLAAAMIDAHYPLQALLYSVALHRFLRWRQRGYDPRAAPRRCALPVPARHVRAGRPGGRRRAVRRLLLAAARGAGRRSCRTCSTGCGGARPSTVTSWSTTRTTRASPAPPPGCWPRSTRRAC